MSTSTTLPDPRPDDLFVARPLAEPGEDGIAATAVLATKPAPALSFVDTRLLARFVESVDRQLLGAAPGSTRDRIMDRLCRLVAVADDVPVGDGIALVATTVDSGFLHLRAPVRDRAMAGDPPTALDLGFRDWPGDPLAIVVVSERRVRCLVLAHGTLRETSDGGFPLRRDPDLFLGDHLARADRRLADVLDPDVPIVVGGVEAVAAAFRDRSALADRIVGVLPGDQSHAPAAALLTLAQRMRHRLTASQRQALADLAVARLHGRVVSGPEAVRAALPETADALVVVEAALLDGDDLGCARGEAAQDVLLRAMAGEGRVVIVPSGRLHDFDGMALVSRHRAADRTSKEVEP